MIILYKTRYWIKTESDEFFREVTKTEWIHFERAAGYKPKLSYDHPDYMKVCVTGGFTYCSAGGTMIMGKIE